MSAPYFQKHSCTAYILLKERNEIMLQVPDRLRIVFSLSQKPSGELMQEAEFRQQEAAIAIIPSDWDIG